MDERLKIQLHRIRDTLNTYGDIVNETRAAAGLPRIGTLPGDDLDGIDPAELPSWHPFDMTDEEVLARIVSAKFLKVAQVVFERHQPVPLYLYPDGTYRDNPDPGTPPMFTLCVCSSCTRRNDKGEWRQINWPCFEFQNLHSALCGDI